jgi:RNA polymerase sigma factor (sigma-70 family)
MTAVPGWDVVSDAELACAAAAGDRAAFAGIYDRYANRLYDFCIGMVRDRDGAADCVQDVFCEAATILPQLRQPDKLRPWLYSIARHQALRRIRDRRREQPSDELPDAASGDAGPDTMAGRSELAGLIAEAAGGMSDRDRSVLELVYRHGLDGLELAAALGVSHTNANTMVQRLRQTIERSLGALLVARHARSNRNGCQELRAILHGWDGQFTILIRKRIARHIESCARCEQQRHRLVNPRALLGGVPLFMPAPAWLREHTLGHIQLVSAGAPITNTTADGGRTSSRVRRDPLSRSPRGSNRTVRSNSPHRTRRRLTPLLVLLYIVVPLTCLGVTITWLHYQKDPATTPAGLTGIAPKPTNTPTLSQPSAAATPNNPTAPRATGAQPANPAVPNPGAAVLPLLPPPQYAPSSPVYPPSTMQDTPPGPCAVIGANCSDQLPAVNLPQLPLDPRVGCLPGEAPPVGVDCGRQQQLQTQPPQTQQRSTAPLSPTPDFSCNAGEPANTPDSYCAGKP